MIAYYYMITGRRQEAVETMETAVKIDPLSSLVNKTLADAYLNAGQPDDALNQIERLLEIQPQMRAALEAKGWATGVKGDWKQALEIFTDLKHAFIPHPFKGLTPIGCAYANLGESAKALECINKIEQLQIEEPGAVLDADLAMIWLSIRDYDKAFHYIFQCVEKKMGPVGMFVEHPMFHVPREDPRFREVKEKMGLDVEPSAV
jgi:tetratricopeptide (TPR) repeat protein